MRNKNPHTLIFGHRNPDTDSVVAATALSTLKNLLGQKATPYRLGPLNKESAYVFERFDVPIPELLDDVKVQVEDLYYEEIPAMERHHSIAHAYRHMQEHNVRTLPIVNDNNHLRGIMTMYDVAMSLIRGTDGNLMNISTGYDNMLYTLEGEAYTRIKEDINGEIAVITYHTQTIIDDKILHKKSIIIVGDRHEIILHAIEIGVELIIVTGGKALPPHFFDLATKNHVNIITTSHDTFHTTKVINLSNHIESIMRKENLVKFINSSHLEDVKEILEKSKHSKFPVIDENNRYLGILSRRNVLRPNRKHVILVDHNEFHQSALGIEEAQVLEIIDHHKIGNIATQMPINFRNETVGATSTIIYQMYNELDVAIPTKIAGLLLSAIISDTLYFKSPTTTPKDIAAAHALSGALDIDLTQYAEDMFRAGTSITGRSKEDIFYSDYKEFDYKNKGFGISQFFTLDIDNIQEREEEIFTMMRSVKNEQHQFLVLVMITDIVRGGSYIYYDTEKSVVLRETLKVETLSQGIFIPHLISRKKQLLPQLLEAVDFLEEGLI
jgi:manganese-dependent inorganic pyrophosphatase